MRDAWNRAVGAPQLGLAGLLLLLSLACASASTPVTQEPRVSTGTPVADGVVQTPGEAATPTPPSTSEAPSEKTGESQATVNDSKDTSESIRRSGGTGGESQAASVPQSGGTGGDDKAGSSPRSGGNSEDNQAPPIPDKGELKYPNLGSRLDELVASVESGETTAEEAASGAAMHSGASVAVTIYLSDGVEEVVTFLEENGGDPRNVGEDYVEAYVPVTLLGQASEQPGVLRSAGDSAAAAGAGRLGAHRPGRAGKRVVPGNDARSGKGSRQRDVVGTTTRENR